jgi:hypothetical protein
MFGAKKPPNEQQIRGWYEDSLDFENACRNWEKAAVLPVPIDDRPETLRKINEYARRPPRALPVPCHAAGPACAARAA